MGPMSYREDAMASTTYTVPIRVKSEHINHPNAPLSTPTTWQAQVAQPPRPCQDVKKELSDPRRVSALSQFVNPPPLPTPVVQVPPPCLYTTFKSAADISYSPEDALKQGVGMVTVIKNVITRLELGSGMRKEVWLREVAGLESQGAPTTLIAVCGATGAGKSSLLNAILDDNIVPTSGMRACTAVVTEIAYHNKSTIDADVSFLSLEEWKQELEVLLDDLIDEDGHIRRATDLRSEAGIAWHKVHAVYPFISQDLLARMTADQIIAYDPKVAQQLGTVTHICTKDSKAFANEIGKYIDSKNQKHDKKSKKADKKKKNKDKKQGKDDKQKEPIDGPALWPLIRQVQVKCKAAALSTGAILVDLPGVADANTARSNICKDYMKKCDCIWVLAPITRAVDDRTSKDLLGEAFKIQLRMDGNYDDSAITFIATKADDISCSEVIRALELENEEELEAVEEKIDAIKEDDKDWRKHKAAAGKTLKAIEQELKAVRAISQEYHDHLKALENNENFQPKLTVKAPISPFLGKRKRSGAGSKKTPKRRKSTPDADDEYQDEDIEDDIEDASESDINDECEDDDSDNTSQKSDSDCDDDSNSNSDSDAEQVIEDELGVEEQVTQESIKAKIQETIANINKLRVKQSQAKAEKKKAGDEMVNAKDRLAKAQVEKNGICSLKRSEFSCDVLKEDFRIGLKEIDDAEAQARDPDSFDPTRQLRNYEDIDLPTFCASARDYIRIKNQVKGDGRPNCFTDPEHTGIPALQEWCCQLTITSRNRAAKNFHAHLRSFVASIRSYIQGVTEVKTEDRNALRELWESQVEETGDSDNEDDDDALDPFSWLYHEAWGENENGMFQATKKATRTAKVNLLGEPIGITPRLAQDLEKLIEDAVVDLKSGFENGLSDKLQAGAANAATAALDISDEFASSMHWQTYRATLRRDGTFRRCLNTELINPLTKNIAASWAKVFEEDLFTSFETRVIFNVNKLLKEIENSAAPGLKERSKMQGDMALEETKLAMNSLVTVLRDTLNEHQKEVSRCLVPHVQGQLHTGYTSAAEERGIGSVARQKAVFRGFIETTRNQIFAGGADTLLERLGKAADTIGVVLENALGDIAQKVEVSMSVLWESPRDDPHRLRARREAAETLKGIDEQVSLWEEAEKLSQLTVA